MAEPTRVDLRRVAQDFQLRRVQVEAVVALLDEGNTVPFIARYRRDQTCGLDEDVIRRVQQRIAALRVLADRKSTVLKSIEAQGSLTDELRANIAAAESLKRLEDLYLPFKPKKQTPATAAREQGLAPLADAVWIDAESARDLTAAAAPLVDPAKGLASPDDVLAGVGHIIMERIAEMAAARAALRRTFWQTGKLTSAKVENLPEDKGKSLREFFDYSEPLETVRPHRVLLLNHGEREEVLKLRIDLDADAARTAIFAVLPPEPHTHLERLRAWATDALDRLLRPSLEREVRRQLADEAEEHAAGVLAKNLRNMLLQRPVRGTRVLAIDPGFRTGCKLAVLDESGKLLATGTVHPHPPQAERAGAKEAIIALAREHAASVVAIGNGSGVRETEELIGEIIAESLPDLSYTVVHEAGAGAYATSAIGREEFPEIDASFRSTISIGRRVQNPLAELVKIEPQHIGTGHYQHDVHHRHLKESLGAVIESCVNLVGVDLNTANVPLLRYVSGLNQLTARRLVEWRQAHGSFQRREQIKEVEGINDAVYTQAVGFLMIRDGSNPLDGTWIHPEMYPVAEQLLARLELTPDVLRSGESATRIGEKLHSVPFDQLATDLQLSPGVLRDLIEALEQPGRDPREDLTPPILKKSALKLEDLKPGQELRGVVQNVVDFGVFVDVGLKESGLVHISQLSTRFIRSPHDVVSVGQVVRVWVIGVDSGRSRVSLTLIAPGTPRRQAPRPQRPARREQPAATPAAPGAEPAVADQPAAASPPPPRPRPPHRPAAVRPAPPPRPPARPHKPQPPPPPLPQAVLDGAEPVRSFGELKRLWDAKKKS